MFYCQWFSSLSLTLLFAITVFNSPVQNTARMLELGSMDNKETYKSFKSYKEKKKLQKKILMVDSGIKTYFHKSA